jgi:hypothetical protein
VVIAQVYFASRGVFPGLVWTAGAAIGLLCLPILLSKKDPDETSGETCTTGLTSP